MEFQKEYAKVIAKAWSDPQFKAQLLKNPEKVLKEQGIMLPPGKKVEVCESNETTLYFVIPQKPQGALSEKELESIAGGACMCLACAALSVKR